MEFEGERVIVAITVLTSPQNLFFFLLLLIDFASIRGKFKAFFWILLDCLKVVFEESARLSILSGCFGVIVYLSIRVHQIIVILFVFSFWVLIRFEADVFILTVLFLFYLITVCIPGHIFNEYTIIRIYGNFIILNLIYQVRCLHLLIINKPAKNALGSLHFWLFKADIIEILRSPFSIFITFWPFL